MNRPNLYHKANQVQRIDAKEVIDEYLPQLQWRHDGNDTLIDIGSGSGDVFFDFIYPHMPKNFHNVVCSDLNPTMVNYAQKTFGSRENCDFKVLDIAMASESMPTSLKGQFDHVTSFYCLHWIRNQRKAFQNIYDLLRPEGGDCLLIFLVTNSIYDVYYELRKASKWSSYMQDIERFTSPLYNTKDPEFVLTSIVKDLNFIRYQVQIRQKTFVYESLEIFRDSIKAINPYLDRVPVALQQEFMDDFIDAALKLGLGESNENCTDYKFSIPYEIAVIYARKSSLISGVISDNKKLSAAEKLH